jgi:hypothetical protein
MSSSTVLYGLSAANCCKKDQRSEKVSNALLPISYGIYCEVNKVAVLLCNRKLEVDTFETCFDGSKFETEKACVHPKFRHAPPNDICITRDDISKYNESKVVMYKESKTELILRQDCFAFNCLQSIFLNNPSKIYKDTVDLLEDTTIVETPYLWMLLWKKTEEGIAFDCIVFTDISVIRMIKDANTERTKEALKLIDRSLSQYESTGIMSYKEEKTSTVAHQKVSLFPLRDITPLSDHTFAFGVKSTDIVLQDVRTDTSLWQEIEKNRLRDTMNQMSAEIARLKNLCGE